MKTVSNANQPLQGSNARYIRATAMDKNIPKPQWYWNKIEIFKNTLAFSYPTEAMISVLQSPL